MSWPDEIPWTPEEQDAYRQNRSLWKRTYKGPSREHLWALWGGHEAPGLIECPECGRPHTEPKAAPGFPLCWNCHTENTRPGWQAEAIALIFKTPGQPGPQGKETNPPAQVVKRAR